MKARERKGMEYSILNPDSNLIAPLRPFFYLTRHGRNQIRERKLNPN